MNIDIIHDIIEYVPIGDIISRFIGDDIVFFMYLYSRLAKSLEVKVLVYLGEATTAVILRKKDSVILKNTLEKHGLPVHDYIDKFWCSSDLSIFIGCDTKIKYRKIVNDIDLYYRELPPQGTFERDSLIIHDNHMCILLGMGAKKYGFLLGQFLQIPLICRDGKKLTGHDYYVDNNCCPFFDEEKLLYVFSIATTRNECYLNEHNA